MKKVFSGFAIAMAWCLVGGLLSTEANAQVTPPAASAAPTTPDVVTLKDGSIIYGEVIEMAGGVLLTKNLSIPDSMV